MGCVVQQGMRGLGFTQVAAVAAGSKLPLFSPEPISMAILAGIQLLLHFFKFGYDPKKLNDTALTEALIINFNKVWEQITDEHLPYACDPGQCGKQHQAIFTRSQWPNVPFPGGKPGLDIGQYRAAFDQAIQEGRAKLQRPQSVADYDANANYVQTLLRQVAERQAQEAAAANPLAALLPSADGGLLSLWPWAVGGLLIYKLIL